MRNKVSSCFTIPSGSSAKTIILIVCISLSLSLNSCSAFVTVDRSVATNSCVRAFGCSESNFVGYAMGVSVQHESGKRSISFKNVSVCVCVHVGPVIQVFLFFPRTSDAEITQLVIVEKSTNDQFITPNLHQTDTHVTSHMAVCPLFLTPFSPHSCCSTLQDGG